ncbi:MAG: family N-acetyltransferase, partial [Acidimicrobiaceae bacterium]|nr:family N-acetyltransferase [Acidimicrobiaceae bacterium]
PGLERHGHGSALLGDALEALRLASYASVTLWVADQNAKARAFYERANWCTDGARRSVLLPGAPWPLPAVRYRAPRP